MPADQQRRDTPAEGIPAISHVQEHDDHFVVTYTDGKSTSVPMEGLKAETLAHIRGMAHGGEVRALAGGRVDPGGADGPDSGGGASADLLTRTEAALNEPPSKRPPGHPAVTPTEDDAPPERRPEPTNYADGGQVPDAGFGQTQFAPLAPFGATDAGTPGGMPFPFTPGGAIEQPLMPGLRPDALAATAQVDQASPYGAPSSGALGSAPDRGAMDLRGAPKPAAPAAAAPPTGLPPLPSGGSGALTELNKGLAEERAGLAAGVDVEKQRDAVLMKLQDSHISQMQALETSSAEQLAAHQRRADDLFQATLNAKIDPNRVWASADVGQRIGAGIGILLSGIGVGLSGGPNLALQVIDRTIDRDIDAQKENLANQRGLLSHYLQQGRDMLSAQQLAKADLKDMFAAQLLRVSAEFGGADAAARAQLAGGQLRAETAGRRQEIMARDLAMSQARLQMQQSQEMQRTLNAAMHPTGGQAPMPPAMAALVMSGPEKMNEHAVQVPQFDGQGTTWRTRYAFNKEVVKDATNAFRKNQNIRGLVQELDALHTAHPLGTALPGDVAKRAKVVANNLKLEWLGGEAGLNRLNERESAYLDQMIVNPADVFSTGQSGAIQELALDVEQNQRNLEGSYLIPEGR